MPKMYRLLLMLLLMTGVNVVRGVTTSEQTKSHAKADKGKERIRRGQDYSAEFSTLESMNETYPAWNLGFPGGTNLAQIFGAKNCMESCEETWSGFVNETWGSVGRHSLQDMWTTLGDRLSAMGGENLTSRNQPSWEQLSAAYIFIACVRTKGQADMCPNPCGGEPCAGRSHTSSADCLPAGGAVFSNDFSCDCQATFTWNTETAQCIRLDVCQNKSSDLYPCYSEHSQDCKLTGEDFRCECLEGWMGRTCEQERDACVENHHLALPPGGQACGGHGTCLPVVGTNNYSCDCEDGWGDDPMVEWPDCTHKEDPCANIACQHGTCQAPDEATHGYCECEEGFNGENCEDVVPVWAEWSEYGECAPLCGQERNRNHTRSCNLPDQCEGDAVETEDCDPKDCSVWGMWGAWSGCMPKCGDDRTRNHTRSCNLPDQCEGSAVESEGCDSQYCIEWSEWSDWSQCDPSCEEDRHQVRTRSCSLGGSPVENEQCPGASEETQVCERPPCAEWSVWEAWSECSPTCGSGRLSTRARTCEHQADTPCPGSPQDVQRCDVIPCRDDVINAAWGEWGEWSTCSSTCEDHAMKARNRTCSEGINSCQGSPLETIGCPAQPCPAWNDWTEWSECSVTCGEHGLQTRDRTCNAGENGCFGSTTQTQDCPTKSCSDVNDVETSENPAPEKKSSDDGVFGPMDSAMIGGMASAGFCLLTICAIAILYLMQCERKGSGCAGGCESCCLCCCQKKTRPYMPISPDMGDPGNQIQLSSVSSNEQLLSPAASSRNTEHYRNIVSPSASSRNTEQYRNILSPAASNATESEKKPILEDSTPHPTRSLGTFTVTSKYTPSLMKYLMPPSDGEEDETDTEVSETGEDKAEAVAEEEDSATDSDGPSKKHGCMG